MNKMISGTKHKPVWYGLVTLVAIFAYFYGLGNQYIPKNGDENLYINIARVTAESGHLLPLQSDLHQWRDTKPPALFWQGIASTHWSKDWKLFDLRYPSVIYTLLTGLLVFLLAWRLDGKQENGFIALWSFLAFFSTYRYGRPFLTNAPEVFWLFLPFFVLLYWKEVAFSSRLRIPLALGVAIGIGLLYKSFMLIIPVGLGLGLWYLQYRHYQRKIFIREDLGKLAIMVFVSLAIFSLWFVFDSDRAGIWHLFVVGENFSKKFHFNDYFQTLFTGSTSIWNMVLGYPINAALLAFPVLSLTWLSYKHRKVLSDSEKMLWLYLLVPVVVFSLPSQRDNRYLLDTMPLLAILLALNWQRISQKSFVTTLLATALGVGFIAYLSWRLEQFMGSKLVYPSYHWLLLLATAVVIVISMVRPKSMRNVVHLAIFLFFLNMTTLLHPFDGKLGTFSQSAIQQFAGHDVLVPYDFNAKFERYRFLLPGARIHGYDARIPYTADELLDKYNRVAFQTFGNKPNCTNCQIIGQRYVIRTRNSAKHSNEALFHNQLQYIFVTEYLLERKTSSKDNTADHTNPLVKTSS